MKITVEVKARVIGPHGGKLQPGMVVELDDLPYTRILIKSGDVLLIDPPSLDPEFLERLRREENGGSEGEQVGTASVPSGAADAAVSDGEESEDSGQDVGASSEGHGDAGELVLGSAPVPERKSNRSNRIK